MRKSRDKCERVKAAQGPSKRGAEGVGVGTMKKLGMNSVRCFRGVCVNAHTSKPLKAEVGRCGKKYSENLRLSCFKGVSQGEDVGGVAKIRPQKHGGKEKIYSRNAEGGNYPQKGWQGAETEVCSRCIVKR